jgi:hypothetical protein
MWRISGFLTGLIILLSITAGCSDSPQSPEDPDPTLSISGIVPDEGPVGTEVTISGQGFSATAGENRVLFAGSEAEVSEASATNLTAIVPDGAETGPVSVQVGELSAAGPDFTVTDPSENGDDNLHVDSIDPDSGPPGTKVSISGEHFGDDEMAAELFFAGTAAVIEEISDTLIVTEVPTGAVSGNVEVVIDGVAAEGPYFQVEEPAATYSVSGTVLNKDTGSGVEGVEVHFSNGTDSVLTAHDGSWSADGLSGPVAVTVQSGDWDFPIVTRLVLGESLDVDFHAVTEHSVSGATRLAYQFREGCSGGTSCDKPYQIWTMASNGLHKEQLTDEEGSDHNPAWSPDALKIVFDSDRSEDDIRTLWIMDYEGEELEDTGIEGTQPHWSPDGEHIVFVRDGAIMMTDLNGAETELFYASGDLVFSPKWSPDGSKIVFERWEGGYSGANIWVMEADGTRAARLTDESAAPHRSPDWEPSGKGILYSSRPASVDRLRLMDVDGRNDRANENWPDHAQTEPVWSPTGGSIAYVSRRMVPISDRIRRVSANPETQNEWSNIAPDSGAEDQFWANSPAWAPVRQ